MESWHTEAHIFHLQTSTLCIKTKEAITFLCWPQPPQGVRGCGPGGSRMEQGSQPYGGPGDGFSSQACHARSAEAARVSPGTALVPRCSGRTSTLLMANDRQSPARPWPHRRIFNGVTQEKGFVSSAQAVGAGRGGAERNLCST